MTPEKPFTAPWQAEAFAMAVALVESGRIAPAAWTAALGTARGTKGAETYWEDWLAALEALNASPRDPACCAPRASPA